MSLKRLILLALVVLAATVVAAPEVTAGIGDDVCPNAAGEGTNTCPPGKVGQPYSIRFTPPEGTGCGPGVESWYVVGGALPPGLSLETNGTLSGTPTQAGGYQFYLEMRLPDTNTCNGSKDTTQRQMALAIQPGTPPPPPKPKLVIGPEQIGVRNATVGASYTLPMTANLPDAKTWSISAGSLPPGLVLGSNDGVIAGTPTTVGSYIFTVQAQIADGRSDTKALTMEVRDRLAVAGSGDFETRVVRTEVGVEFDGALFATGGFGTYLWSVVGALPPGLTLGDDGTITGAPEESGSYRFTVAVTDQEGRRAAFAARVLVAERLAIKSTRLKPAKVGRFLSRRVATVGGVGPMTTKLKRGPLPRGVFFDRLAGIFVGSPTKAGTWKIRVEVIDSLGVKTTGIVVLVVRA
ncbi:MAG: putative Ig domain-containing protein [Actinobacteria bacterium]|nr:putative Ig domain-containing protein [Actinomycetota bacterium]